MSLLIAGKYYPEPRIVIDEVPRMNERFFFHNVKQRKSLIQHIVLHWTGGEGDVKRVYKVLNKNNLSVHFFIDRKGVIWQMADTDNRCSHAGVVNDSSIGIEIANYGFSWPPDKKVTGRGAARATEEFRYKGMKLRIADFFDCQIESAKFLVNRLIDEIQTIGKAVPRNGNGEIVHDQLTRRQIDHFSGIMGHYHCHKTKMDPGPKLIEAIADSLGQKV